MKITGLEVTVMGVPLDPPVVASRFTIPTTYLVVVELQTDEGVTGIGYGAVLREMYALPLARLIENMQPFVLGLDPLMPEAVITSVSGATFKAGPGGMGTWALGAIETAVWDLFGKIAGQPLYRILGGTRDRVTGYALRGLTNRDEAELLDELSEVVEAGWRHVKIQISGIWGDGQPSTVAAAMHRLKAHVGDRVRLALDNQNIWTAPQAIRLGRAIEDLDLFWFEEPVEYRDTAGLAQVARELDTPVCSGEQRYAVPEFRALIEEHGADIVMVDVRMAGGISAFRKIAAACEMWNRPVTSHMMTAIDIHVMASVRLGEVVEYVPWTDAIFEEPIRVQAGELVLPEAPGLGCALRPDAKARYAMS
jgi:L-alanine-DL-glutamate epimerase-like enolase superfamily enzyme